MAERIFWLLEACPKTVESWRIAKFDQQKTDDFTVLALQLLLSQNPKWPSSYRINNESTGLKWFSTKSTSDVIENFYQSAINLLFIFFIFDIFEIVFNSSIFLFADWNNTILSISLIISNQRSFSMSLVLLISVVDKISIGKFQITFLILKKDNFFQRIRPNQLKVIYH